MNDAVPVVSDRRQARLTNTDTEFHASGGHPNRACELASTTPMQRPDTADEMAQSILSTLSSAASYVTGAALNVSGGR